MLDIKLLFARTTALKYERDKSSIVKLQSQMTSRVASNFLETDSIGLTPGP